MKTVIFLHHPVLNDTFAYFPLEKWDRMGNRMCYATTGQQGACCPKYAAECVDAIEAQYKDLKTELEGIYSKLNVKKKIDFFKP